MLSVEGCLEALNDILESPITDSSGHQYRIDNTWDSRFIRDVAKYALDGQAISTAQGTLAVKLIQRYRDHVIAYGIQPVEVDSLITSPHYKQTPYTSTNLPREVRFGGNNKLIFRCKFNSGVVEALKQLKTPKSVPRFNRDHKLWIVDVDYGNWENVMDVIKRHNFSFDDQVANYFLEISNGLSQRSAVDIKDDVITVVARNDSLLSAWARDLQALEG